MATLLILHILAFFMCLLLFKIFEKDHMAGQGIQNMYNKLDKKMHEADIRYVLLYVLTFLNFVCLIEVVKYLNA